MRTLRSRKNTRGQVMVIGALMSMVFVFFWLAVFGVGEAVAEKTHLQDTADAVAFVQATWAARWFNWLAYSNRAIVANFIILTEFAIIHSHAKFWFDIVGVFGLVADALKALFGIGAALDPVVKIAATAVGYYEKFAYYLADIGIPVYHVLIGVLHVMQNAWWIFLIIFPLKSNQALEFIDKELYDTVGSLGVGSLISSFTSTDSSGGGIDLSSTVSSVLQLALAAYTYYQYFMLMFHKEDPSEGNISARVGATKLDSKSAFNRKVSVWRRWKWITEETAHRYAQTKPWSWDNRGLFNFNFSLNLYIFGFDFSSGGDTHFERWSLKDDSMSFSLAGIGTTNKSQKGRPICVTVGLWQWHDTICSTPGEAAYDSFARDFFKIEFWVRFPFVGKKTVFSIGIQEVELSSEDYGLRSETDDSKDPSETARERGETTEESAEGMEEKAEEWYEDAEELTEDANELSSEASEWDEIARERGNEDPPGDVAGAQSTASSKRSSASTKRSQAATKRSDAAAKRSESQQTSSEAQQLQSNAANLNSAIGDVKDTIDSLTSSLYHDGPVLFFWGYMKRWGTPDGPNPRRTKKRFVFPLTGYKEKLTPPYMWEVNTDPDKTSDYKWTQEPSPGFVGDGGRSVAHYVLLYRPYRNLVQIGDFGLEKIMFGDPDDSSYPTPMMGDQYTVFSRGEVFYLNPFTRDEIPNVFNPWWRPRLSPISKDINSLVAKTGLDISQGIGDVIGSVVETLIPH